MPPKRKNLFAGVSAHHLPDDFLAQPKSSTNVQARMPAPEDPDYVERYVPKGISVDDLFAETIERQRLALDAKKEMEILKRAKQPTKKAKPQPVAPNRLMQGVTDDMSFEEKLAKVKRNMRGQTFDPHRTDTFGVPEDILIELDEQQSRREKRLDEYRSLYTPAVTVFDAPTEEYVAPYPSVSKQGLARLRKYNVRK